MESPNRFRQNGPGRKSGRSNLPENYKRQLCRFSASQTRSVRLYSVRDCDRRKSLGRAMVAMVVAWVALAFLPALADSIGPFLNFRLADPTGRYYVVVRKDLTATPRSGMPATFEFAERGPGTEAVEDALDFVRGGMSATHNPAVAVRPGDILLGRCNLEVRWSSVLLSSSGLGLVNMNVAPHGLDLAGSSEAMVIVSIDGTVRHRKRLDAVFTRDEISTFLQTGIGIRWCGKAWIDEARRSVLVIGSRRSAIQRAPSLSSDRHGNRPSSQRLGGCSTVRVLR